MVNFWVILPAAGSGRRMAGDIPKQYLPLQGRTVIEWALQPFFDLKTFASIVVVLAARDTYWRSLPWSHHASIGVATGGAERADSVRSGLELLAGEAQPDDWVLVHDAARPCLAVEDLQTLITQLADDAVGGLLAVPVTDTLKRAGASGRIEQTVTRDGLWRALTPQMFRYGVLRGALAAAEAGSRAVTDEASAVEAMGLQPLLVSGRADNIKITTPADLPLAARILGARQSTLDQP